MDISVIVCGHNEGRLLHRTLKSVFRAVNHAKKEGILQIEILLSLDSPDSKTKNYIKESEFNKKVSIYENTFNDVALSRNYAVMQAKGKYIAFLDGDDLICEEWFLKSFLFLESNKEKEIILHPEYLINFEGKNLIWKRISSIDPDFCYGTMLYANCWDVTTFFSRELALKFPFIGCPKDSGWGMEDYHLFLETLGSGVKHIIVKKTVVFIRVKGDGSRLAEHVLTNATVNKNVLFDPNVLKKYIQEVPTKNIVESRVSYKKKILNKFPKLHLFLYRIKQWLLSKVQNKNEISSKYPYPDWLINEWKQMNKIEAEVYPSSHILETIKNYKIIHSNLFAKEYINICEKIGFNLDHLIIVPFIKVGGAEKVLFNFIQSLQSLFPEQRIVVLATEKSNSPWSSKLPENVPFVDIGNWDTLSYPEEEILLKEAIIQLHPKNIYVMSSQLALILLSKHAKVLSENTKLYAFFFCEEYDDEGKLLGYAFLYLDKIFDYLTKIFTDNEKYIDLLCDMFGFNRRKFQALPQPMEIKNIQLKHKESSQNLKLLWASRLDSQKHPEIVFEIAKACSDLPISIDVYGTQVLDSKFDVNIFKGSSNIQYCGTFSDGLKGLPNIYDGFIYTSEYDGMPNVILEAIELGLPIISSNVGGIGYLLEDKKSALLVNPFNNIAEYRMKILYALENRQELENYGKLALKEVRRKHNWRVFNTLVFDNIAK